MYNKSDEQFLFIQAIIDSNKQDIKSPIEANKKDMKANRQETDEKMTQFTLEFETMFVVFSNQLNNISSSPTQKDT